MIFDFYAMQNEISNDSFMNVLIVSTKNNLLVKLLVYLWVVFFLSYL